MAEMVESRTGAGSEKKTRRRLRLSCVECTKRRQRCDRQLPCGSCMTRGVTHLCRWESVPVARPAPGRPRVSHESPSATSSTTDFAKTVQQLSDHIGMLEHKIKLLSSENVDLKNEADQSLTASESILETYRSHSVGDQSSPDTPLNPDVQEAAISFAQLSLAHHGEYIGGGTVVSALHKLGQNSLFKYSKSTDAITTNTTAIHQSSSVPNSVPMLALGLPSKSETMTLVNGFFGTINWRFGIPEQWFRTACNQMWGAIDYPDGTDINANWLSLLYSVLAIATQYAGPGDQCILSKRYFLSALSARRLAEDNQMALRTFSPLVSAADGIALSCLATPLLCHYHADSGRVSEAWKLVGYAIRAAQAVGMHRDPGWTKWQVMSEDERLLRTRAWWGLVTWDRLYSYMLGRPPMIRKNQYDVKPEPAVDLDGSKNYYNILETALVQLSDIVGETIDKCLGIECPTEIAVFELDRKFKEWEARLSPEFRWNGDLSQSRDPFIIRQSYILATWYIACRMKLHLSFVTQPERAPSHSVALKQSRDKCIELSMELVRLQNQRYAAYMDARRKEALPRVNWSFEGSFSLFDGAVSLVTALAHTPAKERRKDAEELVEEAKAVLSHVVVDGLGCAGEVSRMAAGVLHVLGQEGIWRSEGSGNENLSITESSEPPLYAQRWFQAPSPSRAISKQTPEDTFSKPHPSVFLSRSGWPSSLRPLYTTLLA